VQLDEKFPTFRRTVFKITKISEEANCIVNCTNTAHWNCVRSTIKKQKHGQYFVYLFMCDLFNAVVSMSYYTEHNENLAQTLHGEVPCYRDAIQHEP